VQAVYTALREAEYRSTAFIPYWKVPLLRWLVPRQRACTEALVVINNTLDGLISKCQQLVGDRLGGRTDTDRLTIGRTDRLTGRQTGGKGAPRCYCLRSWCTLGASCVWVKRNEDPISGCQIGAKCYILSATQDRLYPIVFSEF
jgi:hypothetical protein